MNTRLVYSTDAGRICPGCSQAVAACTCKAAKPRPAGDGIVRIRRETAGRKGKGVTTLAGLPGDAAALAALAKQMKALCGSGGTVKDGVVEIQGDHLDKLLPWLQAQGFTVKRAGG
jgi:translation initiation factor 1